MLTCLVSLRNTREMQRRPEFLQWFLRWWNFHEGASLSSHGLRTWQNCGGQRLKPLLFASFSSLARLRPHTCKPRLHPPQPTPFSPDTTCTGEFKKKKKKVAKCEMLLKKKKQWVLKFLTSFIRCFRIVLNSSLSFFFFWQEKEFLRFCFSL